MLLEHRHRILLSFPYMEILTNVHTEITILLCCSKQLLSSMSWLTHAMDTYHLSVSHLWISVFCFTIATVHCIEEQPLFFTLMVSNASTLKTTGVIVAVNQALDVVNNDSDILSGYTLKDAQVFVTPVSLG